MLKTVLILAALGLIFVRAADARAAPCTLVAVDKPENAKLRVYFTKFLKEDNTEGKYKSCRIIDRAEKDSEPFFITPFRQDATVIVHRDNWPKSIF